jgi:hypothetical protein
MQYRDLTCYHRMQFRGVNYSCLFGMNTLFSPTLIILGSYDETLHHTVVYPHIVTIESKIK